MELSLKRDLVLRRDSIMMFSNENNIFLNYLFFICSRYSLPLYVEQVIYLAVLSN